MKVGGQTFTNFVKEQASLHESVDAFKDTMVSNKDRKSTRLNSSHVSESRMPSSA